MKPECDWLGGLKMGETGHQQISMRFGLIKKGGLHIGKRMINRIEQIANP